MANVVKHKRSSTAGETPAAADLEVGEIAINTADAKLFVKHTDGNVVEISGSGGGGGASLVWTSGNATTGTTNYWAKVATFAITGNYNDGSFIYAFFSEESGTPSTAIIQVSVRQNGTGQDNGVDVELISAPNSAPFSDDSFKLLDDGSQTDIELWVKKNANYHSMKAFEIGKNTESVEVTYHQNSTWQATEPTGTGNNVKSDGIKHQGNKIWHAGNDGANSGLDADLLDGQHGSYYLNLANATGEIAEATSSAHGGLRIGYSENGKNYPVELNNDGQAFVNVPWVDTDTNTTYSTATSSTLGLVKIGYTESGKNYPVELDNGQMYVNVPWTDTDTNTTYSTATSSALGLVKIGYTESGKNYPVELDNGQMYVNVPWTDNNTTYSTATSSTAGLVKIGYTESGKNYPVELDNGQMYVNVPWTDTDTNTTYSAGTAIDLSGTTFSLSSTISGKRDFTGGVVISNPSSVGHIQMGNIGNDQQNAYIRGAFLVQRDEDQITYDSSTDTWTHAGGGSTDWSMWAHTASGMRFYTGAAVSSSTDYTPAQFDSAYLSVSIGTDGQWDWKKAAQFSGNVTISGNLTVSGSTTTVNSGTINLADSVLTLNSDLLSTVDPTENAGFEVNRGTGSTVGLIWNETNDEWTAATSNGTYYKIWHAGNDGSGSTLDADTLDGVHGSSFLRSDAADSASGQITFTGKAHVNTNTNTQPLVVSRGGSNASQRLNIGITDTQAIFNYVEDTSSEGNGNFGSYQFQLGGNDGESTLNTLYIQKNYTRIATLSGNVQIGPQNTSYSHFYTDRPAYYFDKKIHVDTGELRSHDEDLNLNRAGSATARLRITDGKTISDQDFEIHDDAGLNIKTRTNAAGAKITFSDQTADFSQVGTIEYKHADGAVSSEPQTSNDGFIIRGTEANTVVRVQGDVDVDQDLNVNGTAYIHGEVQEYEHGAGYEHGGSTGTFKYYKWGVQIGSSSSGYKGITIEGGKYKYFEFEANIKGFGGANHQGLFWGNTQKTTYYGGSSTGYKTTHQNSTNLHIRDINSNSNQTTVNPGFDPNDGNWHHYKVVASPDGYLRVYLDGDKVIEATGYIPTAAGYVGFINYAGTAQYSNIQFRALTDDFVDTADQIGLSDKIYHNGDTDTYMQFQGANQWRVVAGGSQKLKIDTSIHLDAHLYAGNFNIYEVNALQFNDPGPNEGLEWVGGSGWKIYESPDDLTTNSGGNLQFVTGSTRRMTLQTDGDLNLLGENVWFDGTNTYLRSDNDFKFLTDGGSAQRGRFKSIQVSTSYSGTPPDNGILFGTDVNLYRNAANELKTDDQMEAAAFKTGSWTIDQNSDGDLEFIYA